ncbi:MULTISPECIES: replicative DNA helicase [unclassified Lysobacter]|uniref:replicative DNA helicase n=1 Tax=unclassified Lysobacter TaxID=2635362 RepID=UPI0006FE66EC|nr:MULTISPECIES: replicative DNA helicase [unclassified Lysobacter]KRC35095.1 hypothetical protein ASE10_10520 [Lysobacter sp. Root76]KRD70783.1 hypothetical protein ASE45_02685 [Lysobacter sp. Root96]
MAHRTIFSPTAESFYRRDHQLIWQAVSELVDKRRPFDAVTLGEWFASAGMAEHVAGGAYLMELARTTPSAANIRAYAEIVADKARLRRVIDVGAGLENMGFNPDGRNSVEIVGHAMASLGELMQAEPCELEEVGPVLVRVFENLQRRYELGGALDGVSTGLTELDRVLNGLKGGRLYVLAARPKMGKTSLALGIARAVAVEQRQHVAFFTFEMPPEELMERMVCAEGEVDHDRFRRGQLEDEEWSKVTLAIRRLRGAPLRVSRPRTSRIDAVCAQARRRHAKKPLKLIVLDYLQLLDTKGAENHTLGVTEISQKLKMLAGDLDVPVLALSQLNRAVESRPNKRPMPADLSKSTAASFAASTTGFGGPPRFTTSRWAAGTASVGAATTSPSAYAAGTTAE